VFFLEAEEAFVEHSTFLFEYADKDLYTCIAHHLYASASHLRIGVECTHNHTTYPLANNQFGTRRSLTVMATGFETDIQGTMLIINTLGVCLLGMAEAVGFGMWTTILLVPALTQNMIPLRSMVHQDSPYHGIGRYIIFA
jgi:hypothetical protein